MSKKGPGRAHREGISVLELMDMFPDEDKARQWFEGIVWPDGNRHCPRCGSHNTHACGGKAKVPYRCRDCNKYFSVKTGTVMQNSPIPLRKWAVAIYYNLISLKGVSSMRMHRDLKITQKNAWHLQHRIRCAFASMADDSPVENGLSVYGDSLFTGPIEADETYIGGRKPRHIKGRGPVGKFIVAGVKERASKQVRLRVLPDTKKPTVHEFIHDYADPDETTLYTDENPSYKGAVADHEWVNHSAKQYVDGMVHVNGMESFWATLKRAYHGTFHKMSLKHLSRYADEFAGRHNIRDWDTVDQMTHVAACMVGKSLAYKELTADEGLPSGARKAK